MKAIILTRIIGRGPIVMNIDRIDLIAPVTYIGEGDKSIPCTRISINDGFVDVEEQFDTVLKLLGIKS